MKSIQALNEAIAAKSKALAEITAQAASSQDGQDVYDLGKVTLIPGDNAAKLAYIQAAHKELSALGKEREGLLSVEQAAREAKAMDTMFNTPAAALTHPGSGGHAPVEVKDIGQLFVESKEFKAYQGQRNWPMAANLDVDLKTLFQTGAGWTPAQVRLPGIVLSAQRPIGVVDFFPQFPTTQSTIRYMKETTFTSTNAVEKAEQTAVAAADIIGEVALAVTEASDEVEWLPVFIPVTMQQMEDVEGIQAYLSQRLTYMLQARLDIQLLQGTGVTPLLLGTNTVVATNVQAKGADPTPDAIYKAMRMVRAVGFAEPTCVCLHPNDWQDIRLLRTADGIYIFGSPMDSGPERIWGVPVHVTTAALENTATLGDFTRFAAIYYKRGITIAVSDSHAFYFTRGTLAVRADMRLAVVHTRETAFARVTGI